MHCAFESARERLHPVLRGDHKSSNRRTGTAVHERGAFTFDEEHPGTFIGLPDPAREPSKRRQLEDEDAARTNDARQLERKGLERVHRRRVRHRTVKCDSRAERRVVERQLLPKISANEHAMSRPSRTHREHFF